MINKQNTLFQDTLKIMNCGLKKMSPLFQICSFNLCALPAKVIIKIPNYITSKPCSTLCRIENILKTLVLTSSNSWFGQKDIGKYMAQLLTNTLAFSSHKKKALRLVQAKLKHLFAKWSIGEMKCLVLFKINHHQLHYSFNVNR